MNKITLNKWIFAVLLAAAYILSTAVNCESSIFGGNASAVGYICTVVYLVAWLLFAFPAERSNKLFLFSLIFWGCTLLVSLLQLIVVLTNISADGMIPLLFVLIAPLNGLSFEAMGITPHIITIAALFLLASVLRMRYKKSTEQE